MSEWLEALIAELAETVWEFSEEGGGDPDAGWLDLYSTIGEATWQHILGDDNIQLCNDYSDNPRLCGDCFELVKSRLADATSNNTSAVVGIPEQIEYLESGTAFFTYTTSFVIFLSVLTLARILIWVIKTSHKFLGIIFKF